MFFRKTRVKGLRKTIAEFEQQRDEMLKKPLPPGQGPSSAPHIRDFFH